MVLFLIRHGKSLWNKENRFTGKTDIDLCEEGINEAKNCAKEIFNEVSFVDACFTSDLLRAKNTANIIKEELNMDFEITNSRDLDERDYGDLTGENKDTMIEKYGEEQIRKWRRSYFDGPPNGENLHCVVKRVGEYFDKYINPLLFLKKNVLIVAHGNSLRALMVHLKEKNITDIENFEFSTGTPYLLNNFSFKLKASQILDSRGYPTIQIKCLQNKRVIGVGSSPSGASCGTNEAIELRDCDCMCYDGKSVNNNVEHINNILNNHDQFDLNPDSIEDLKNLDNQILQLDNSEQKNVLGGNTTTALSFCFANAGANFMDMELYEYFNYIYNNRNQSYQMPVPMVNILNGGKHAGGSLKIQEFMIMPSNTMDTLKQVQSICEVYYILKKLLVEKYGVQSKNVGDEGGFTPNLSTPDEAIDVIVEAINQSNYEPNQDIFIALDCAASEFYNTETQLYEITENNFLNSTELVNYYNELIDKYPIIKSIEDPFHESDYEAWISFTQLSQDKDLMIVGDDLFTTNPKLVQEGLDNLWCNSLLLKVNQIGTITEAVESATLMFNKNHSVIVSHRSGETNQSHLVDLAVGIGAQYVKIGAPARGERVEKFNRLTEIYDLLQD